MQLFALHIFHAKKKFCIPPPNSDLAETQKISYSKILKSGDDDHDTTGFNNAETSFADTLDNIPTTNISVYQSMLHFSNFTAFSNTFNALVNKREDLLDNWIENFTSFKSLRGYYNTLLAQPSSDHYEIEISRIQDPYIEILMSEDFELRIADTIYSYNDSLTFLNLFLVEDEIKAETSFASKRLTVNLCGEDSKFHNSVYDDYDYGLVRKAGTKWVYNFGIIGSIGFKGMLFSKKDPGAKFKKEYDFQINTYIDQYYQLSFWNKKNGSGGNPTIMQNIRAIATDFTHPYTIVFHEAIYPVANYTQPGFLGQNFLCVNEFGRTHNWNDNFPGILGNFRAFKWEEDAHVDIW